MHLGPSETSSAGHMPGAAAVEKVNVSMDSQVTDWGACSQLVMHTHTHVVTLAVFPGHISSRNSLQCYYQILTVVMPMPTSRKSVSCILISTHPVCTFSRRRRGKDTWKEH